MPPALGWYRRTYYSEQATHDELPTHDPQAGPFGFTWERPPLRSYFRARRCRQTWSTSWWRTVLRRGRRSIPERQATK